MGEPDVTKKKKRKRSVRVYVNVHKPVNPEAAALIGDFPDDDDGPTPAHMEATARTRRTMKPGAEKGTVAGNPHQPGGRSPADPRVSPSRVTGQAAASTGDHGAQMDPMAPSGPRELAFRHPDLREGSTTIAPWVTLRTRQGDNQNGDRDITYVPGQVGLASLATAGAAGVPRPAYNPASRPLDHVARNSATPPNGSHGLANPVSTPRPAMKNSDLRAEFKRMLFPGSGAR